MSLVVRRTGGQDYGRYIKTLIVGSAGAGKTLVSSTFPNAFYASAEGGLMSIADRNILHSDITSSAELLELLKILKGTPEERAEKLGGPVDTIVVDTIDEVQKLMVRERLLEKRQEQLQIADWNWLGDQMRGFVRGYRSLPMNVVFTCHLKETTDSDTGRVMYNPALQGSFGTEITECVDLSLLLTSYNENVVDGKDVRRVTHRFFQTYKDPQHMWIKDRSGKLPEEFMVNFEDDYQRMHDAIYGGIPLPDTKSLVVDFARPEPEPEPVVAAAEPVEEKVEDTGMRYTKDCPKGQELCEISQDQADLSRIRFRKELCKDCFKEAKQ